MVKYSTDVINEVLTHIRPIQGRPTFETLYTFAQELARGLRKLKHPEHPDEGWAGYMMDPAAFTI